MLYAPYSYSKLDTHKTCPRKFKLRYIDKIYPFIDAHHLDKGTFIHYLMEIFPKTDYSKFESPLSEEHKLKYSELVKEKCSDSHLKEILSLPTVGCEVPFGLDAKLKPTNYYDKQRILGGYIDRISLIEDGILITDFKTGKVKEYEFFSNDHQIVLYAIWAFKVFNVNKIVGRYVHVEHNEIREFTFDRKYLMNYSKAFGKSINTVEKDSEFPKKISKLCETCEYLRDKHCEGANNV